MSKYNERLIQPTDLDDLDWALVAGSRGVLDKSVQELRSMLQTSQAIIYDVSDLYVVVFVPRYQLWGVLEREDGFWTYTPETTVIPVFIHNGVTRVASISENFKIDLIKKSEHKPIDDENFWGPLSEEMKLSIATI